MNVLVPLILFLAGPQCDRYILKVFKKKKKSDSLDDVKNL